MSEPKNSLRKAMLEARRNIPPARRAIADASIRESLKSIPQLLNASMVAAYASDGSEPELAPLLQDILRSGRRVCLPRSSDDESSYGFAEVRSLPDDLSKGRWGISEPKPELPPVQADELKKALWLVPGVAFDARLFRLGRGKGVYDRLLANGCGFSIGVFYECQRCGSVPLEGHDLALDMVVTEAGIVGVGRE